MASALLCGSPAYGQTKFNVMNLSIARTADSPLPTVYLGALCLLVFLAGVAGPIINIMPRFLLGGLCVFAGFGFLYENLWEGRKNMNRMSFGIVWVIFLVNFVWEVNALSDLFLEKYATHHNEGTQRIVLYFSSSFSNSYRRRSSPWSRGCWSCSFWGSC